MVNLFDWSDVEIDCYLVHGDPYSYDNTTAEMCVYRFVYTMICTNTLINVIAPSFERTEDFY